MNAIPNMIDISIVASAEWSDTTASAITFYARKKTFKNMVLVLMKTDQKTAKALRA